MSALDLSLLDSTEFMTLFFLRHSVCFLKNIYFWSKEIRRTLRSTFDHADRGRVQYLDAVAHRLWRALCSRIIRIVFMAARAPGTSGGDIEAGLVIITIRSTVHRVKCQPRDARRRLWGMEKWRKNEGKTKGKQRNSEYSRVLHANWIFLPRGSQTDEIIPRVFLPIFLREFL